ncbi:hypothetical protein ABZ613_20620 [Streptomyces collinus]
MFIKVYRVLNYVDEFINCKVNEMPEMGYAVDDEVDEVLPEIVPFTE